MNQQKILLLGALFGGLGIALGALGAHALKPMLLASNRFDVYEIAVRYQVYHALALLLAGVIMGQFQNKILLLRAIVCWVVGILLFSGSLYVLSFSSIPLIAYLTPLGGLFLLAGWGFLIGSILKNK